MSVQLQKATQENYYRAVMVIFPLAPDQTIAQMWSNGARGGTVTSQVYYNTCICTEIKQPNQLTAASNITTTF